VKYFQNFIYLNKKFTIDVNLDISKYESDDEIASPLKFNQKEYNDLTRDLLILSINGSELWGSRLKEKNLLESGTKITAHRSRSVKFRKFYQVCQDGFAFCPDVSGLMLEVFEEYNSCDWRLFIDGSVTSLKVVLLHNGSGLFNCYEGELCYYEESFASNQLQST
jgi:hypothetical protein